MAGNLSPGNFGLLQHNRHKAAFAAAQINQSQRDQSGHRPAIHCRCPASFKTRALGQMILDPL